jgi:hypothetical protein
MAVIDGRTGKHALAWSPFETYSASLQPERHERLDLRSSHLGATLGTPTSSASNA